MGTSTLRRMQYGKETVHGTAVAATRMLPVAVPQIKKDKTITYPREDAGVRAEAVRSYLAGVLARDSFKFTTLYYQYLPLLFSCGLKGGITATQQTAGQGDYLWAFVPAMDATSNAQESITIERGDDDFMVETEYAMFETLKLSGEINQEGGDSSMQAEVSFFGRQNTVASFTGGLSIPTGLTPVNSKLAKLFIDTTWAGVGGTEKTNTLRAFDIEIITGLHPKFHGSGANTFDNHGEGPMAIMGAFTFEGGANAAAIYSARDAQTLQVVRLSVEGPQIGSGEKHTLELDFSGTWEEVIPLASESNGNNLWTAVLHGHYDPTGGKLLQANVITSWNAI